MAYFECIIGGAGTTLTVTCDSGFAGKTITCTDGTTTLTAVCPSASPYVVEFDVETDGTWTISGTVSGTTHSITMTIQTSADLHEIPNGSTVTPVANIQTWLHCANIWDKDYTTISQVLNDATTLLALISSNNAADYMARSTSWASSVCANAIAMQYIGNNNYCANKLLANSTWYTAICNSTYFESVLNVKVPTMTSNTEPSGTAISLPSNANAYRAFDGNIDTYAGGTSSGNTPYPHEFGYIFPSNVKIAKIVIQAKPSYENYLPKDCSIQYTTNGSTWSTAKSNIVLSKVTSQTLLLDSLLQCKGLKIHATSGYYTNYNWSGIHEMQFYGRASS